MMRDYEAEDLALDEEIKALYASDSAPDTGTAEEENEPEKQSEQTEVDPTDEVGTSTEEPTVPESRYKEAVRAMSKAQQELAEIKRQDAAKDAKLQELYEQLADRSGSTQESDASDLDDLQENYPEIVNPLISRIKDLESKLKSVSAEVGSVKTVTDRTQKKEQNTAADAHRQAIVAAHSDAYDLLDTPEYVEWFGKQAPLIQQSLRQGSAQDVISALDLFRMTHPKEVAAPDTSKADKLALAKEAATPSLKGRSVPDKKQTFTTAQIEKMTRQEFMKHEAAIDEALARGEVF
jgi:hypothetical protein